MWGWAVPPLDAQALPVEMTWNPELQQLCFDPLVEQAELRSNALATPSVPTAFQDTPITLGPWADSVGNQSEIITTFTLPTVSTVFGVVAMAGADATTSGAFFFVDFTPATDTTSWPRTVRVGAIVNRTAVAAAGSNPHFSCNAEGVKCHNDTLQLTATDTNITLRVFVDNNLAECFWQTNRVASIVYAPPTVEAAVALISVRVEAADAGDYDQVYAAAPQQVTEVKAWQVGGIWISNEEMLSTPRADGTPIASKGE
jgi:hypothetical protein